MKLRIGLVIVLLLLVIGCNKIDSKTSINQLKIKIYPQIVEKMKTDLMPTQDETIYKTSSPEILELVEDNGEYYVLYTYSYDSKDNFSQDRSIKKVIYFQQIKRKRGKYILGSGSGYGSDDTNVQFISGSYQDSWQYGLVFNPKVTKVAIVYDDGITIVQEINHNKHYLIKRTDKEEVKVKRIEMLDNMGQLISK